MRSSSGGRSVLMVKRAYRQKSRCLQKFQNPET